MIAQGALGALHGLSCSLGFAAGPAKRAPGCSQESVGLVHVRLELRVLSSKLRAGKDRLADSLEFA